MRCWSTRLLVILQRVYILGPRTNLTWRSSHGESKEEGQEESFEKEVRPSDTASLDNLLARRTSKLQTVPAISGHCRFRAHAHSRAAMTRSRQDGPERERQAARGTRCARLSAARHDPRRRHRLDGQRIDRAARRTGLVPLAARRGIEFRGHELRLRAAGIAVLDLNDLTTLPLYIDGADEATRSRMLIKGGGAALTREKIVASCCRALRLHHR